MSARTIATPLADLRGAYRQPSDPSGLMPFWLWTGELEPSDLADQIDEFIERGVGAATILCFPGHVGGFLSETFFGQLDAVVQRARERSFSLWIHPDYGWPAGEGRDVTDRGPGSRVIRDLPAARMQELHVTRTRVTSITVEPSPGAILLAAPIDPSGEPNLDAIVDLSSGARALDGTWELFEYRTVRASGIDGGLVDLMSADATDSYIRVVLEPVRERYALDFGTTIAGLFLDHEGDYGGRIAWTPRLFEMFADQFGYGLEVSLPWLDSDSPHGRRVRCDYFALVGSLYAQNFFARIRRWAEAHGALVTGHVFEEKLQMLTGHVGDFYAVQRALSMPGVDSLFDWGESPRHIKEAASIAALRGTGLAVESNGCLGMDGHRDPGRLRRTTGALAVWGATHLVHSGFVAHDTQQQFPPDSRGQPWWPDFGRYADYARRLTEVNRRSQAVVQVAILHPREDAWADGWPLFRPASGMDADLRRALPWEHAATDARTIFRHVVPDSIWYTDLDDRDAEYGELMEDLVAAQWDFLAIDNDALVSAIVTDSAAELAGSTIRALVIPRMHYIDLDTAKAIERLHDAGVLVLVIGEHEELSDIDGTRSGETRELIERIVGEAGHGVLVARASDVVAVLDDALTAPVRVVTGPRSALRLAHRRSIDTNLWTLWSSALEPVELELALAGSGSAFEVWDPEDGAMLPIEVLGSRVRLRIDPGVALHLVEVEPDGTDPAAISSIRGWGVGSQPPVTSSVDLDGPWAFETLDAVRISRLASGADLDALEVNRPTILGVDHLAAREWLVAGPFDNDDWGGVARAFGPEESQDLDAAFDGLDGPTSWIPYRSPSSFVNLDEALSGTRGAGFYDRPATAYAYATVKSERAQEVTLNVVPDTCVDIWLGGRNVLRYWDHRHYIEPNAAWAHRKRLQLPTGDSSLLVKISRYRRAYLGGMGFMLWLTDRDGGPPEAVEIEMPGQQASSSAPSKGDSAWYRFTAPMGTASMVMPASVDLVLVGGDVVANEPSIQMRPGDSITLRASPSLFEPILLRSGLTAGRIGSWIESDLRGYAGRGRYRLGFDVDPVSVPGHRVYLDLGSVGATAHASLNGVDLGTRAWAPYRFDVTDSLLPGRNELEIIVANSEAPARAERAPFRLWRDVPVAGPELLPNIGIQGLVGPVRLDWRDGA